MYNELQESIISEICGVVSFATTDLYLQQMSVKANKVCRITKNVFAEFACFEAYTFPRLFILRHSSLVRVSGDWKRIF